VNSTTPSFHDPIHQLAEIPYPDKTLYGKRSITNHCTVKSVKKLTHDTCELIIKAEQGSQPISHAAGQYAILKVDDIEKPRAYSFARSPKSEAPDEYSFFIRQVPGGKFSSWLFNSERKGQPITIQGPIGKFTVDPSDKRMLCIAGGSGMSAIFALLEDSCYHQIQRNVLFLYGARSQRDLYCLNEIKILQEKWHPDYQFEFVPVLSEEPEDSDWQGGRGLVTDYLKKNYLDTNTISLLDAKAYFCGPPPMIDAGIATLTKLGMQTNDIYYDKFEDIRSPVPVVDNAKCVLCDECLFVCPIPKCIIEASQLRTDGNGLSYEEVNPIETSSLYYNTLYIDAKQCIRCYACVDVCPVDAIDPENSVIPKTIRKHTVVS